MIFNKQVQPLYNETGRLMGVFIAADKWFENEKDLEAILFPGQSSQSSPEARPEPVKDWEVFLSYWDFNYPEEKKVKCDNCGSNTEDWSQDNPRKFVLKAANIGGMVSFQCQQCSFRVTKKHFKDHICYECTPFTCKVG
ncbi:MAG: hypothetical protein R6X11_08130 [Desulfonatronovibrio sp.]